jgi:dTDP-4-dehydrorhamnose 3,5-epimerase
VKLHDTQIEGVKRIELSAWLDNRGAFVEALPASANYPVHQINLSKNESAGTVRGMHWQVAPAAQVKIVYAVAGRFLDVAVDIRRDSPTYGSVVTLELHPFSNALYIPAGVAHGCQALDGGATLMYLLDVGYDPKCERGFRVDDPAIRNIWPMPLVNVAPRDMKWPWMKEIP